MTHLLKIRKEYFEAILDGRKQFDLRRDDRDYKVGDRIQFVVPGSPVFEITYKLENVPQYGLQEGFCILGIRRIWQ